MTQSANRADGTRARLRCLAVGALLALLAACGSRPAAAPGGSSAATGSVASDAVNTTQKWNQILDAARKEGAMTLYAGSSSGLGEALTAPFERAFPGIKVTGVFAPVRDQVPRLLAERQGNKFIPDVHIGGVTSNVIAYKPIGAVAALPPALILPEVSDAANWFQKRLWWADTAEPYTTLAFQGYVEGSVLYNSKLVDPGQFSSYWNLLDPKWKGKIVASDVRRGGVGSDQARFIYGHPDLGPTFLDRLFSEGGLVLSNDQRQMVDWLAQGRYPLGLWVSSTEMIAAANQGLPVAAVPGGQFKEGALMSVGSGTIALADPAPHQNAARLFINWFLSKEGQIAWQRNLKQPSLRTDIPKDGMDPATIPQPGVTYADGSSEEFNRRSSDALVEVITNALNKTK